MVTSAHLGQRDASYRFDWGLDGLRTHAATSDVVVIVDVLRFSTAVCCAVDAGMTVWPYPWNDDGARTFAARHHAVLAGRREHGELSLSPTDLMHGPPGTHLVLPSPNGSTLAGAAQAMGADDVLAGCVRNARATAQAARTLAGESGSIAVIAAGERWPGTDTLRPAVEDLIGAGAILAALDPSSAQGVPRCSPEAQAARAAFIAARPLLYDTLRESSSGRELIERGWEDDVATASCLDVCTAVPVLTTTGCFVAHNPATANSGAADGNDVALLHQAQP
jgi:2-phosphosulfolactate phosphatase